ncbi:insulinase family protein [Bacillus atrophaeus]|uniref:insulinase family protein n=1 Tax=Bacillus atrophaeus TaxID=1452 RepID=UPI0030F47F68
MIQGEKVNDLEMNLLTTDQFSTISIAASFLKPIEIAAEPEGETIYFYGAAAYLKQNITDIFGYAAGSRFIYSANLFFDRQLKTYGTRLLHPLYHKNLNIDDVLETFVDRSFLPASLPADIAETAKADLLLKIEKKFADPFSYSAARLAEETFGSPMYGTAMFGRKEKVQAIQPKRFLDASDFKTDLLSQQKKLYVIGNVQELHAGGYSRHAPSMNGRRKPVNKNIYETETRSTAGPSVMTLGFDCGEMNGFRDYIKIQLIDGLLGKYGHSALFRHFREKQMAVYHVITRYDIMSNLLLVSVCTDRVQEKEIPPRVIETVMNFHVDEQELEKAKQFLKNEILLQLDSPEGLLAYMGILRHYLYKKEDILDGISTITCRDLLQYVTNIEYIGAHVVRG